MSLANCEQTAELRNIFTLTIIHPRCITCRQLSFFFQQQNIQTSSFSSQQPCYIISSLTFSFHHSSRFFLFHIYRYFSRIYSTKYPFGGMSPIIYIYTHSGPFLMTKLGTRYWVPMYILSGAKNYRGRPPKWVFSTVYSR